MNANSCAEMIVMLAAQMVDRIDEKTVYQVRLTERMG